MGVSVKEAWIVAKKRDDQNNVDEALDQVGVDQQEPNPNEGDGSPQNAGDAAGEMSDQEKLIRSRHGQDLTPMMLQAEKDRKAQAERPDSLPPVEVKPWDVSLDKLNDTRQGDEQAHQELQDALDARRQAAYDQQVTQRDEIKKRHSKEGDDVRDPKRPPAPGAAQAAAYNGDLYPSKGRYRADVEGTHYVDPRGETQEAQSGNYPES